MSTDQDDKCQKKISIELSIDQASLLWYILVGKGADLINMELMSEQEKELIWLAEDLVEDSLVAEKKNMTSEEWDELQAVSSKAIREFPEDLFD